MTQNFLKLNTDKTVFIVFGTRQQLAKVGHINIKVGSDTLIPVEVVRNLSYMMDKLLKYASHIKKLSSNCFGILRDISKICQCVDKSTKLIVQALVQSQLDYCSSPHRFSGIPTG